MFLLTIILFYFTIFGQSNYICVNEGGFCSRAEQCCEGSCNNNRCKNTVNSEDRNTKKNLPSNNNKKAIEGDATCCDGRSCIPDRLFCTNSVQCCSKKCNNGRCAPQVRLTSCAVPGEVCSVDNDCCTKNCRENYAGNGKTCRGSQKIPAPPSIACDLDLQCGSNNCDNRWKVCLGDGGQNCSYTEMPCRLNYQCCSGHCDTNTNRCMPSSIRNREPLRRGVPCFLDHQCPNYCDFIDKTCR